MTPKLWRGYHEATLRDQIKEAWQKEEFLILCPPFLQENLLQNYLAKIESAMFLEKPVLGVFTSGTVSGEPRLILYSKKNIEASLNGILEVFKNVPITSIFCYPQALHTFGLTLGYVLSIVKYIPLIAAPGKYGKQAHELRTQVTDPGLLTLGTPTHFYDLIEYLKTANLSLKKSASCIVGGASVTQKLWRDIQEKLFIEKPTIGYGCTEASPGITHHPPGLVPEQDGEIGFPLKNLNSTLTKEGVVIDGPSLCMAIINKEEITFPKSTLIRDDIFVREKDSMWIYKSRLDFMLNRGGMKYSLEYLEQVIFRETDLRVICSTRSDDRLGQELCVLVDENQPDRALEKIQAVLQKHFALKLSKEDYRLIKNFPLNDSQKVDRVRIQKLFERTNDSSL